MDAVLSHGPGLAPDAPLSIVVNAGSGDADANAACTAIADALASTGRRYTIHRIDDPATHSEIVAAAVSEAGARHGVVVAAGGDGTLRSVAAQAVAQGLPFAAVPLGTFNLFARTHGIPQDIVGAISALSRARLEPVQAGRVNGRVFLVNASLGLYPEVLEDRERFKAEHGRSRVNAIVSGLRSLLHEAEQLRLDVEDDGDRRSLRTPSLFVGNNPLQLARLGIGEMPGQGWLTAIVVRPIGTAAMFALALRGALGTLGDATNVDSFRFHRLGVAPRGRRRIKVAVDGEVLWMDAPLRFDVSPEPLWLLRPAPEDRVATP